MDKARAAGGLARAKSLSKKERSEIAKKAADARWLPQATHEGEFSIGDRQFYAAVLTDGRRVLTQRTLYSVLGRSNQRGGSGQDPAVGLPPFLQAQGLKPFISAELTATSAIPFLTCAGTRALGYEAKILPMVCEVFLTFRDSFAAAGKAPPKQYANTFIACEMVMRGLARVGIIGLVDEATGYQEVRDRHALQKILDLYLQQEFSAWAKRFPDEFYKEIFRLRKWEWRGMKINRPQCVANYTNNLVYERLAPGILEELERLNPKNRSGERAGRHHQLLTEDIGHKHLATHLASVVTLMKVSKNWDHLMAMVDQALPKKQDLQQVLLFPELETDAYAN